MNRFPEDISYAVQALEEVVCAELEAQVAGIGEYELLKRLRERGEPLLQGELTEPLVLFRCHFLLYHALHRLREQLWQERRGHLHIEPLAIRLGSYRRGEAALTSHDPLRDYYLDLGNLEATDGVDVLELLASFWRRIDARDGCSEALKVLELEESADWEEIKRQYRRLAMQHHPDRGGDTETLQRLNEAFALLKRSYY